LRLCLIAVLALTKSRKRKHTEEVLCIANYYVQVAQFFTYKGKEVTKMAGKSKTDVAARTGAKTAVKLCSACGNKIDVVMSVSSSGKKSMKRLCCEL